MSGVEKSDWLSSFEKRGAEARAIGELNVERAACVAGARKIISSIRQGDVPGVSLKETKHLRGSNSDPTMPDGYNVYRLQSSAIEIATGDVVALGRIAYGSWWSGKHAKYVYVRELDGSEADELMWSRRDDVRVRVEPYRVHEDEPDLPVAFTHIPYIRSNIQDFDTGLVEIADAIGIDLPTPEEVFAATRPAPTPVFTTPVHF